jgi:hypothetical protein
MRHYSPTLGRWIEVDPDGHAAGDSNLYRYVSNDPTNGLDSSGLFEDGGQTGGFSEDPGFGKPLPSDPSHLPGIAYPYQNGIYHGLNGARSLGGNISGGQGGPGYPGSPRVDPGTWLTLSCGYGGCLPCLGGLGGQGNGF